MWVFLSNAFLSVVSNHADPQTLLVRARFGEDLTRVFPNAKVEERNDRDYRFRTIVSKVELAERMAKAVLDIDYHNFKSSVSERWRHDCYLDVWGVMNREQGRRHGPRKYKSLTDGPLFDDPTADDLAELPPYDNDRIPPPSARSPRRTKRRK